MPAARSAKYKGELLSVIVTCARMTGSFVRPSSLRESGGLPLDVSFSGLQGQHLSATTQSWTSEDITNIDAMLQYYGMAEEHGCSMASIATEGYFRRVTTPGPSDLTGVDMFELLVKAYAEQNDAIHVCDVLQQLSELSVLRAFEVLQELEAGSASKIGPDVLSDIRSSLVAHCRSRQSMTDSRARMDAPTSSGFSSLQSALVSKPWVVSNIFFRTAESVVSREL